MYIEEGGGKEKKGNRWRRQGVKEGKRKGVAKESREEGREEKGMEEREGSIEGEEGDKLLRGDFLTDHKSVWRLEVKRQGVDLTSYSLSFKSEHKVTNSDDILSQQILVKQLRVLGKGVLDISPGPLQNLKPSPLWDTGVIDAGTRIPA